MTGIMSMIAKIKKELKEVEKIGNKSELKRLKMIYQSLKGARNAGTHGILSAPNVSGRQFNLWGAAAITTKGQIILDDTLRYLEKRNIRVVYGDILDALVHLGIFQNFQKHWESPLIIIRKIGLQNQKRLLLLLNNAMPNGKAN